MQGGLVSRTELQTPREGSTEPCTPVPYCGRPNAPNAAGRLNCPVALLCLCQALNAMNIYPEIVVGTSAGAIVGAAYACGRHQELENYVKTIQRMDIAKHIVSNTSILAFLNQGGVLHGQKLLDDIMEEILGTSVGTGCG